MAAFEQGLAEDVPRAEPAEKMLTEPAMNDNRAAGSSLRVNVTGNTVTGQADEERLAQRVAAAVGEQLRAAWPRGLSQGSRAVNSVSRAG